MMGIRSPLRFVLLGILVANIGLAIDCEYLQKKNWGIYVTDFGIDWDDGKLDCDEAELTFAKALYALHAIVWKPVNQKKRHNHYYYRKASSRIDVTNYDPKCKYIALGGDGKMTLCPKYFVQAAARQAATIVHEARHMELSDPGHADCKKIDLKRGCDAQYGGAASSGYTAAVRYFNWILRGAQTHELEKWEVTSQMNVLVPNRFNEISKEDVKYLRSAGKEKEE